MKLKRVLGPVDAGWLVAGNMIGAGIFITPGLVVGEMPGGAAPLVVWVLGGLLALAGAAVYGELGARLPHAGGDYQYLASAFGPLWGFLTGWAALLLTFSAAAALMSIVAVDYLAQAAWASALPPVPRAIAASSVVLVLTAANVAGARTAGNATAWLTAVPLAGLGVLFGYGLLAGEATIEWPVATGSGNGAWPLALGAAMLPVFYTYSGWNAAAYLAAEIRDPGRNLALGLLGGTAFVSVVYLLVNVVLLLVVPQAELAGSTTAGARAAHVLLGPAAERVLAALIAIAVLGSANVTLMAGARIYYAMAGDGLAPRALGRVNRAGVPSAALWLGGIWTAVLATSSRIEFLLNWCTLAILLLSSLAVAALFVLRRRDPDGAAFRCPGYPVTPALYLVASLSVAASSAYSRPLEAMYGLAIVSTGIPAYFLLRRRTTASPR